MKNKWMMGWLFFAILLSACQKNDIKVYTGENALQLSESKDTLKRYSFYFKESTLKLDTVWLKFRTTGYTSDSPREFLLEQMDVDGVVNAIAGTHYQSLDQSVLVVPTGSVYATVPVVLMREQLKPKTSYFLSLHLKRNDYFELGESDKLRCVIEFSAGILKPTLWSDHYTKYYLGAWSYNKHVWLIDQTKHNWDDDFLESWKNEPGLDRFWKEKLNELLVKYNQDGYVLLDDENVEITGFPN